MDPSIVSLAEKDGLLKFTLNGVDVSIANAIRRIIISDIPTIVFKTTPYEENKANVITNTTRLNNEIIKHRLSNVPIHLTDDSVNLDDYEMVLDKTNTSDNTILVTTKDFKIRNTKLDQFLPDSESQKIFPPNPITTDYIEFVRLRPAMSSTLSGESIQMTCKFTTSTAKQDGAFAVASTCTFSNTVDDNKAAAAWSEKAKEMKANDIEEEEIAKEKKNWYTLQAKRLFVKDSFDFIIESVGVFENRTLVHKACDVMILKITNFRQGCDQGKVKVTKSESTMENSFDIVLENEDYTLGKVLEYILFTNFFGTGKPLSYCGFKKNHPHDDYSIIRIAFNESEPTQNEIALQYCIQVCNVAEEVFKNVKSLV
tara:strand:- start:1581 stop:2690 length:1110 start_codon:yes stop_codon:yes gene_type:complete